MWLAIPQSVYLEQTAPRNKALENFDTFISGCSKAGSKLHLINEPTHVPMPGCQDDKEKLSIHLDF